MPVYNAINAEFIRIVCTVYFGIIFAPLCCGKRWPEARGVEIVLLVMRFAFARFERYFYADSLRCRI